MSRHTLLEQPSLLFFFFCFFFYWGGGTVFFNMVVSLHCVLFLKFKIVPKYRQMRCLGLVLCECRALRFLLIKEQREENKLERNQRRRDSEGVPGSSGVWWPWLTTKVLPHPIYLADTLLNGRFVGRSKGIKAKLLDTKFGVGPRRFRNILILTNLLWTRRPTCRVSG